MDLLNKFIMDNFGGKTPCELNCVDTMLKGIKATLEDFSGTIDPLKGDVVNLRHENDGLREKVDTWQDKEQLARDALAVACEEMAHMIQKRHKEPDCSLSVFEHVSSTEKCDYDCPVCLVEYFIKRAKADREAVENNRMVKDEIEGRKAMDGEDQKKAMKEALSDEA